MKFKDSGRRDAALKLWKRDRYAAYSRVFLDFMISHKKQHVVTPETDLGRLRKWSILCFRV